VGLAWFEKFDVCLRASGRQAPALHFQWLIGITAAEEIETAVVAVSCVSLVWRVAFERAALACCGAYLAAALVYLRAIFACFGV
jgi:hypothetical protein